jgi:GNAT superfamily N-acetyltransferase
VKRGGRKVVAVFNPCAYNSQKSFIGRSQNQITIETIYRGAKMNIRYGTKDDAIILSELGARTFYETFAQDNTPENIDAYIKKSFSPEIQFSELSEPDVIFLIAESEGVPIGYAQLLINSKDESITAIRPLEIIRIYASQEYIGKGVGKELMKATISEARAKDCDGVWLGVW